MVLKDSLRRENNKGKTKVSEKQRCQGTEYGILSGNGLTPFWHLYDFRSATSRAVTQPKASSRCSPVCWNCCRGSNNGKRQGCMTSQISVPTFREHLLCVRSHQRSGLLFQPRESQSSYLDVSMLDDAKRCTWSAVIGRMGVFGRTRPLRSSCRFLRQSLNSAAYSICGSVYHE